MKARSSIRKAVGYDFYSTGKRAAVPRASSAEGFGSVRVVDKSFTQPGEPSSGKPALDAKDSTKGSGNLSDGSGRYCLSFELGCSRKTLTPTIPRFTSETKVSVSGWHYWRAHDNSPQIWGNHVHGSMKLQRSFQQIIYIYMDFC